MNYKPNEETLMAYLYDELSTDEKQQVENYLAENPEVQQELEGLRDTRSMFGLLKDKDVQPPSFVLNEPRQVVMSGGISGNGFLMKSLAIAASISLLLLVGYLTSFRVTFHDGVEVAFGEVKEREPTITQQDVMKWVDTAMARDVSQLQAKIDQTQDAVNQSSEVKVDQEVLDAYLNKLRAQNNKTLKSLIEQSEQDQKAYTDQMLNDLAFYMDVQHQQEMDNLRDEFESLATETQQTNRQTNRLLSVLMDDPQPTTNEY